MERVRNDKSRRILLVIGGVGAIGIVCLGVATHIVLGLGRPNWREYRVNNQVYFAGDLRRDGGTSYVIVRARGPDESALTAEADLVLHVGGTRFPVHEITPRTVTEIGNLLEMRSHGDGTFGFLGWGEQNREGGIEFTFADRKLTGFFARWHPRASCPFGLSAIEGSAVRFPVAENDLVEAFGEPMARQDKVIH